MTDASKKIDQVMEQEENILAMALARALGEVNKKATVQNLRDYEAAKESLEAFRKRKAKDEGELTFENPREVCKYLNDNGYKLSEAKAYYDYDSGLLAKSKGNKNFTEANIKSYIKAASLSLLDGSKETDDVLNRLKWEAVLAEEKAIKLKRENEIERGKYLLRSEVEQQLAARAAFLKENLGSGFIHSRASKIAEILKGNPDNTPELIEFWLKQIKEVFDYYSKPLRFEVPIAAMENAEEEGENES